MDFGKADDLREFARQNDGCNEGTIPMDEIEWEYISDFPVTNLEKVMSEEKWRTWMAEEIQMLQDDYGETVRWSCLLDEEIEEPCVFLIHNDGNIEIWDGWHRSAASVCKGAPSLKVVVGRRKDYTPGVTP